MSELDGDENKFAKFAKFAKHETPDDIPSGSVQSGGSPGIGLPIRPEPVVDPDDPKPIEADGLWPKPIPEWARIGVTRRALEILTEVSEADPSAIHVQFLLAMGSIASATAYLPMSSSKQFPIVHAIVVGGTGDGRKGTSLNDALLFPSAACPEWAERIGSGLSSGEGLIHAIRDPDERRNDPGVTDKRMFLPCEEFAEVFIQASRRGNTLMTTLRQLFDCKTLCVRSISNPKRASDPRVVIVGHITPEEFHDTVPRGSDTNGFLNRSIVVASHSTKCLPDFPYVEAAHHPSIVAEIREIEAFANGVTRMAFSPEATGYWRKLYPLLRNTGFEGSLGSVTRRGSAIVPRLGMIFALIDRTTTIGLNHLKAAEAIWRYSVSSAAWLYNRAGGTAVTAKILEHIREAKQGVTKSALFRLMGGHMTKKQMASHLSVLRTQGHVESKSVNGPGTKPTEYWSPIYSTDDAIEDNFDDGEGDPVPAGSPEGGRNPSQAQQNVPSELREFAEFPPTTPPLEAESASGGAN